jgi:hypothetical protein
MSKMQLVRLMLIALPLSGCTMATYAPPTTLDITNCDPQREEQCYSVTTEFVERYLYLKARHFEMKEGLKTCQERL